MAAYFLVIRCIVLLNVASICLPTNTLTAVLNAIDKILHYYEDNITNMNLDGFFGLRVLEGQLEVMAMNFDKSRDISIDVKTRISNLHKLAVSITKRGAKVVEDDDPEYYKQMSGVISAPWTYWKEDSYTDTTLKWGYNIYDVAANKQMKLTEEVSDMCMSEIMGTGESTRKCGFTSNCTRIMTFRGLTHYGITHQILWSMLAENKGCLSHLDRAIKTYSAYKGVDHFRKEMCTNNFIEMRILTEEYLKGIIYPMYQDLFLEQQFVCPCLGYGQFLNAKYLSQILSWQYETGCYGRHRAQKRPKKVHFIKKYYNTLENDYDYDDAIADADAGEHVRDPMVADFDQRNMRHRRKLLAEKPLSDGCLAHKTAVAAGALVMYLRYLVFPSQSNRQGNIKSEWLLRTRDIPDAELVDKFEKLKHTINNEVVEMERGNEMQDPDNPVGLHPPDKEDEKGVLNVDKPKRRARSKFIKKVDQGIRRFKDFDDDSDVDDQEYERMVKIREVKKRLGEDNVRIVSPRRRSGQHPSITNLIIVIVMLTICLLAFLVYRFFKMRRIRFRSIRRIFNI